MQDVNSKICYDIVRYIKPKEFCFVDKNEREMGFIAQDIPNSKMPKQWSKVVMKDDNDYLRLFWSAVPEMQEKTKTLKTENTKLKNNTKGKGEGT